MESFSLLLKWLRTTGIAHHSEFCGAKEAAVWHWVAKGKGGRHIYPALFTWPAGKQARRPRR